MRKYSKITQSRTIIAGEAINLQKSRKSLFLGENFMPDNGWCIKFKFPFDKAVSKNAIWSIGGEGGHLYRRKRANQYQEALALRTRAAIAGRRVYINKIWIDLFVQKPSHKSDAVNVLDTVCDALKIGLGVDDRWFCIKQLDWEITKKDPHIFISIYQKDTFDARPCSHCGRIFPMESFTKSSHGLGGRGRSCFECRTGRIPDIVDNGDESSSC